MNEITPASIGLSREDLPNSYIGRSVPRPNLPKLVQGRAAYTDDVTLPRMAHAAFAFWRAPADAPVALVPVPVREGHDVPDLGGDARAVSAALYAKYGPRCAPYSPAAAPPAAEDSTAPGSAAAASARGSRCRPSRGTGCPWSAGT
jgi:CO/xanthine dehydrogenase Mo-binding subunit